MGRPIFEDRVDAGRTLAVALQRFRGVPSVVFGLPRGGVILANEVARELGAPLDLVIAHKLSHPTNLEYAVGAITEEGYVIFDSARWGITQEYIDREKAIRIQEAKSRREAYLGNRGPVPVEGKVAILIDDGLATGYTMRAAILSVRSRNPAKIVIAAPVGPPEAFDEFRTLADEIVLPNAPSDFYAVGVYYQDFQPVDDHEVIAALKCNWRLSEETKC